MEQTGPTPVFGTAHLYGKLDRARSDEVLAAALALPFHRVDTAPSYGHGDSEVAVGRWSRRADARVAVTTKVGLWPAPMPSASTRVIKGVARRLPAALQQRLRSAQAGTVRGQFGVESVRQSVELSLARLGPIDRLMLHEVHPEDLTDELLDHLDRYRRRGDVGALGVATANELTAACIRQAPAVFTAAHICVGPFAPAVTLPSTVSVRVGHGVLGAAAASLHELTARREADPARRARWRDLTESTRWAEPNGLADALLARAATLDLTDVIVATSSVARLGSLAELVGGSVAVPVELLGFIDQLVTAGAPGP